MGVRCFVAVDIEDGSLIQKIIGVQGQLSATRADVKCVEPENIHFTLKFLGDVPESQVQGVQDVVSEIAFQPFRLGVNGVGVFPNLKRPRTIWAGVDEGVSEIAEVHGVLDRALGNLGFERERRKFHPHATICRVRSGKNRDLLVDALMFLSDVAFGGMEVRNIRLKKSVLTSRGPIYTILAESKTTD